MGYRGTGSATAGRNCTGILHKGVYRVRPGLKKEISDECEDCEEQSECVDCTVRRVRKEYSAVTEPLGGSFEIE